MTIHRHFKVSEKEKHHGCDVYSMLDYHFVSYKSNVNSETQILKKF